MKRILLVFLVIMLLLQLSPDEIMTQPSPLFAKGKWLVNAQGVKVSLHGVNIWSRRCSTGRS
ncbi:MAG: hypothetical protein ACLFT3_20070 [Cyclobacteriaceae bacterium]